MEILIEQYKKIYDWLNSSQQIRNYWFIGSMITGVCIRTTKMIAPESIIIPIIETLYVLFTIPYIHVGINQLFRE